MELKNLVDKINKGLKKNADQKARFVEGFWQDKITFNDSPESNITITKSFGWYNLVATDHSEIEISRFQRKITNDGFDVSDLIQVINQHITIGSSKAENDDSFWVIFDTSATDAAYYTGDGRNTWDPDSAMRFKTEKEANKYIKDLGSPDWATAMEFGE